MDQASINDQEDLATCYPGMPEKGWIGNYALPVPSAAFLKSFEVMPKDTHAPDAQRHRTFSQFMARFDRDGELLLKLLPHRPFVQSAKYNSLSGGVLRLFEPIAMPEEVKPYVQQKLELLSVDKARKFHIDVHLYRVYATAEASGNPVPEGAHRDGMEAVAIDVLRREGITEDSARFSLINPETKRPFLTTVVQAGQGFMLNDQKMLHDAGPIATSNLETGHRDYIVININRWEHRRYGRTHEERAQLDDAAGELNFWDQSRKDRRILVMNARFEEARTLVTARSGRALHFIHGIKKALQTTRLYSYDDLNFTAEDVLNLMKEALVSSINRDVRRGLKKKKAQLPAFTEAHVVKKRLGELQKLNGDIEPDPTMGVLFDRATIDTLFVEPELWGLQRRAQMQDSASPLNQWLERHYPRENVCV